MSEPKKPWDQEPTPLCDENEVNWSEFDDEGYTPSGYMRKEFAQSLERRLRFALKLINALRIDVMHGDAYANENETIEERLTGIEEVLQ